MGVWAGSSWNLFVALGAVPFDGCLIGGSALATQRQQVAAVGVIEHEDSLGGEGVGGDGFGHGGGETGGDDGIEGVSARQHHPHARHRRQVVAA